MKKKSFKYLLIALNMQGTYAIDYQQFSIEQLLEHANHAQQSGNIAYASETYASLVKKYPDCTVGWYNLAHTCKDLNLIDDAIKAYQKVLTQDPEHVFARFGLGQCYGSLYEYELAFPLLELRGSAIKAFHNDIEFLKKAYSNNQSLSGMRIILRAEWGLGDNIQFIRYAQLLHSRGAYIIMHSYPELQQLLQLCPYLHEVISAGDAFPTHHLQIPLLSLPYVCSITQKTCTSAMPYLQTNFTLNKQWQIYLEQFKTFNIGICWKGNGDAQAPPLLNKNISLALLSPLCNVSGISVFSLQGNIQPTDVLERMITFDASFDRMHGRFMDTASLINSLDLIITIDTSIAHLAGALNKRVWLLLPFRSDWRWGIKGDETPFYPSMRLFRQKNPGDWQAIIEQIMIELKKVM